MANLGAVTYTTVVWTAGDIITEAKLDNMVANDQAYDSHAAQGLLLNNAKAFAGKSAAGVAHDLLQMNAADQVQLGEAGIDGLMVGYWDDWVPVAAAVTYVSVDDPTGVVDFAGDVRSKYRAGMKFKFTNGGNVICAFITDVNQTLQSGKTRITFLHEIDPADNQALTLMANSAITLPYVSTSKAPTGFPLDPTKWRIIIKDTTYRYQDNPVQNTWYNVGSYSITLPIGLWRVSYAFILNAKSTSTAATDGFMTLSTANNTESDKENSVMVEQVGNSGNLQATSTLQLVDKEFNVASKTVYYLNARTDYANINKIGYYNQFQTGVLKADCAYL